VGNWGPRRNGYPASTTLDVEVSVGSGVLLLRRGPAAARNSGRPQKTRGNPNRSAGGGRRGVGVGAADSAYLTMLPNAGWNPRSAPRNVIWPPLFLARGGSDIS
jgi:hypothetical protein